MGYSRQASATTFPHVSLFTKGDDSAKTVVYGVVSDGRVLGLFVPLPPAVLTGFPQGAGGQSEAEREADSLLSREPNAGLIPGP